MLSSPAHRAGLRFLRGGLIAIVALLVPSQLGGWAREWPAIAPLIAASRLAIPALGFAAGGVVGASALGRGGRGAAAFGAGFGLTGLLLSFTAPLLRNLSGFENSWIVVPYAAASTAAAFGLGGVIGALALEPRQVVMMGTGFAAGGALGGLVSVLPSLSSASMAGWPSDAQLFVRLLCSLTGLLAPFAIGGAVAGKALEE
jgi:hypothetical protein